MLEIITERFSQMEMDVKNHKNDTMENEANVLKEWRIQLDKFMKKKKDKKMKALYKGP